MGVQGLEELVQGCQLLDKYEFRYGKLVIDGSNLMYNLYFDSDLDQSHGGDYVGFKDVVGQFFQSLDKCDIKPYVVLDGGSDSSDRKLDTLQRRFENNTEKAFQLAHSSPLEPNHSNGVLPPLIKDVFKQILHSLGVPFAQCFGEADSEIFSLANEWECPVLSNDSDFYMFHLKAGFLPLRKFQWKQQEQQHINTMLYKMTKFCDHFEVDRVLLPVFASIAGNDYARLEDRGKFSRNYAYEPIKSDHLMSWRVKRLYSILRFLKTTNLQDQVEHKQEEKQLQQEQAVDKALALIDLVEEEKQKKRKDLLKSIQTYAQPPDCPLALFFENDTTPEKPDNVLPDWTLRPLTEGRLTSFIIDILRLKRMILSPQVEDFSQRSGHYTARPIRQHLYGLLLGRDGGCVKEYDRRYKRLICEEVPVLPTKPHLQQRQPTQNEVFMEALGVSCLRLDTIPDHLRLPVCVIHFWKMHSKIPYSIPSNYLYALLLGVVHGDLCRQEKVGQFKVRMTEIKERGEKKPLHLDVAHAFSQWQCCLKESLHLNQSLCFPLPEPECAWLYCGPLVHQLVAELRGSDTRAPVTAESLLEGDTTAADLFNKLLAASTRKLRPDEVGKKRKGKTSEREKQGGKK